jgi:predicted PurR-regulated permease PerM
MGTEELENQRNHLDSVDFNYAISVIDNSGMMNIRDMGERAVKTASTVSAFTTNDSKKTDAQKCREVLDRGMGPLPEWIGQLPFVGSPLRDYWATVAAGEASFIAAIKPYVPVAGSWLLSALASIGSGVLELILSLVIAFFFYRDGPVAASGLYTVTSRIGGERATRALAAATGTITGVVHGIIGTNFVQGYCRPGSGQGYPGFLLGFLCFFLTMIPIAPTLVWLPASLWLFYNGSTGAAIVLAIWSFLVFNTLENVLRPYLISRGSSLPMLPILLGMLGGLTAFGLLGIFVGPTILAVAYSLITEWTEPTPPSSE